MYFGSVSTIEKYPFSKESEEHNAAVVKEVYQADFFLSSDLDRKRFGDDIYEYWNKLSNYESISGGWKSLKREELLSHLEAVTDRIFKSFHKTDDMIENCRIKSINYLCHFCGVTRINKILVSELHIFGRIKSSIIDVSINEYDRYRIPYLAHVLTLLYRILFFRGSRNLLVGDVKFMNFLINQTNCSLSRVGEKLDCPDANGEVDMFRKPVNLQNGKQTPVNHRKIETLSKLYYYHVIYCMSFRIITTLFKNETGVFDHEVFEDWMNSMDIRNFSIQRLALNFQYIVGYGFDFQHYSSFYFEVVPFLSQKGQEHYFELLLYDEILIPTVRIMNHLFDHPNNEAYRQCLEKIMIYLVAVIDTKKEKSDLIFESSIFPPIQSNEEESTKLTERKTIVSLCVDIITSTIQYEKSSLRCKTLDLLFTICQSLKNSKFCDYCNELCISGLQTWERKRFFLLKANLEEKLCMMGTCYFLFSTCTEENVSLVFPLRKFILDYCIDVITNEFEWYKTDTSKDYKYNSIFAVTVNIFCYFCRFGFNNDLSNAIFGTKKPVFISIMRMFYRFPIGIKRSLVPFLMWCIEENSESVKNFFLSRSETDDYVLRRVLKYLWETVRDLEKKEKNLNQDIVADMLKLAFGFCGLIILYPCLGKDEEEGPAFPKMSMFGKAQDDAPPSREENREVREVRDGHDEVNKTIIKGQEKKNEVKEEISGEKKKKEGNKDSRIPLISGPALRNIYEERHKLMERMQLRYDDVDDMDKNSDDYNSSEKYVKIMMAKLQKKQVKVKEEEETEGEEVEEEEEPRKKLKKSLPDLPKQQNIEEKIKSSTSSSSPKKKITKTHAPKVITCAYKGCKKTLDIRYAKCCPICKKAYYCSTGHLIVGKRYHFKNECGK